MHGLYISFNGSPVNLLEGLRQSWSRWKYTPTAHRCWLLQYFFLCPVKSTNEQLKEQRKLKRYNLSQQVWSLVWKNLENARVVIISLLWVHLPMLKNIWTANLPQLNWLGSFTCYFNLLLLLHLAYLNNKALISIFYQALFLLNISQTHTCACFSLCLKCRTHFMTYNELPKTHTHTHSQPGCWSHKCLCPRKSSDTIN